MATYTTQLKTIIENINGLSESAPATQIPALIEKARPIIFGFDYPITDTSHKPILERKILQHYLFREIGFETVALWNLKLNFKMNEIMPYYDELYKSAALKLEPLANYGFDETANAQSDTTSKSNQTTHSTNDQSTTSSNTTNSTANSSQSDTGKDTNAYSETPQGSLSGVENLTYLTDARIIDSTNTTDTNSTGKTTSDETSDSNAVQDGTNNMDMTSKNVSQNMINRKGFQGTSQSELLQKYRETILNIDLMVIDALSNLFMLLY